MELVILALLGAVHDALAFRCVKFVAAGEAGKAALLAGVLNVFSYLAYFYAQDTGHTIKGILAYAVGSVIGTYWMLRKPTPPRP